MRTRRDAYLCYLPMLSAPARFYARDSFLCSNTYTHISASACIVALARAILLPFAMRAICIVIECECRLERWDGKVYRALCACTCAEISISNMGDYHNRSRSNTPIQSVGQFYVLWLQVLVPFIRDAVTSRTDGQSSSQYVRTRSLVEFFLLPLSLSLSISFLRDDECLRVEQIVRELEERRDA